MKLKRESINRAKYFLLGIFLFFQINGFCLGTFSKQIVINHFKQDTSKLAETIFYKFRLINNSDTILNSVDFTDSFISNAICFQLPTQISGNLQISAPSLNQLTTHITIDNISIGHSSFYLAVDVPNDLIIKSNFCKNERVMHLYFPYPEGLKTSSSDHSKETTSSDMLCITIEMDKYCDDKDDNSSSLNSKLYSVDQYRLR